MDDALIEKAYDLVDEIKTTQTYRLLKQADEAIQESKEVSTLIETFKKAEEHFNEVKKYATHHPEYETSKKAFQKASYELFRNPLVKQYKKHERALNTMLDEIATELGETISPRLNIDTGLSFSPLGGKSCKKDAV